MARLEGFSLLQGFSGKLGNQVVIFVLFCAACSPQARLARLLHRHPELAVRDTLTLSDTLITPMVTADTVVCIERLYDTITLDRGKLQVALCRLADTIYVTGRCKADTVVITRQVAVEKIRLVKPDIRAALIARIHGWQQDLLRCVPCCS